MSDQATIDRLSTDLALARKAVRASRRAFVGTLLSKFVRKMQAAIGLYQQARKDGVSREDAAKGLELELRDAWPKSVSKFVPACPNCDDTGWLEHTCWDQQRCGREVCARNPERQHLYVEPCGCSNGDRMRKRVRTAEDAIAAAGRTTKRKAQGWRQVGS